MLLFTKLLAKGTAIFDRILDRLVFLAGALLIFIMLSIAVEIIMRYFLNRPIFWVVEVSEYCLLYILFLSTAWVLKREGHVKIDILLNRLKPKSQCPVNLITSIAGTIICLALVWYSAQVTWETFQMGYHMTTIMEPPKFAILAIVPVGSLLLVIQFLRRTYGYLNSWRASRG